MKNIAVITGASSGIGRDLATIIDKKEALVDEIWLFGTNVERLKKVQAQLNIESRIFSMDLTKASNLTRILKLFEEDVCIKILVNSAGFGVDGQFHNYNFHEMKKLMRLNMEALTILMYNAIPYMNEGSRIINIASSAGFMPQPGFAIYAASKSYVLSLSRAVREELKDRNIFVTAVCPGPVETRFFNKLTEADIKLKLLSRSRSIDVALKAYKDNLRNKDLSVFGIQMNIFRLACKIIPKRILIEGYVKLTNVTTKCFKAGK